MKLLNITARLLVLLAVLAISSCNNIVDYNDGYDDGMKSTGAPAIEGVYTPGDVELASPITSAGFGEYIMLKGYNLSNVKRVLMNDVEVDMNDIYATAEQAWFAVPSAAPTEITNKITYVTALGETTFDFTVIIPDVTVSGLYNEMAPAGTAVKVVGSYFALHGFGAKETSKVTMNGTPLEVSEVTDNGMVIQLPDDAQPNSTIDFEWVGTSGHQTISVPYARKADLIYEDWSTAGNYGDAAFFVKDDPDALCGPYFRVNASLDAWSWNTLIYSGFNLNADIAAHPSDYLLKFEVRSAIDKPFPDSGAADGNGYCITLGDDSNKVEWNPSANESFNTFGEWCTVRLELADLIATVKPAAGWVNFIITLQPTAAIDADHSFANFRIEKK